MRASGRWRSLGFCALVAGFGALLGGGSCVETDIGVPCRLVKTGAPLPGAECQGADDPQERPECFRPTLADLREGIDKDFVSFGAAECDNLTCVRSRCSQLDASGNPDPTRCADTIPEGEADTNGFCSGECINDQDCVAAEGAGSFTCRPLVLDDAFLNALKENLSAEEYERYFGRIQNAKFCAPAEA